MAKVIKKIYLSAESGTGVNEAVLKGTPENPYTQLEMQQLQTQGTWNGGYVEGEGYITSTPEIAISYPFYFWPTMPVTYFIEMCKLLYSKDDMYEYICSNAPFSSISEAYFHRYWYAQGNKVLSSSEFNDIIGSIGNSTSANTSTVRINDKIYVKKTYNLEGNSTYRYVFGSTCYVYYDDNTPVGFKDDYDFNPLPFTFGDNGRRIFNELLTRAMNILGPYYGAESYSIRYGVFDYKIYVS